ncbi:MAG: AbrB/MazE/SpoVT family DNA-binding domain-containing protein [bacterium]
MTSVTVGERFQIVIPKEVRNKIPLKPHSKVQIKAQNGYLIIQPITGTGWRGIGREIADGTDGADYIGRLRAEWNKRS